MSLADPRQPDILPSDDESDDSDYVDSGGSSESSDAGELLKTEGDEEDKENRERRLDREYASMKEARDNLYVPPSGAHRDSVWESFNRRQGAYEQRKDNSLRGLMGMLSKVCYAASKKESPEEIDIARYKEEARAAEHASEHAPRVVPMGAVLDEVRKADKVEIDSHMKYA
ncbi:hypothetical protein FOZ63_029703, partial [Perkinsus olseni]